MRKLVCLLLAVLMVTSMAACGKPAEEATKPSGGNQQQTNDPSKQTDPAPGTTAPADDNWGSPDAISTAKDYVLGKLNFRFPQYSGLREGPGLIADQGDGTRVLVTCYMQDQSPETNSLEEVLPAYSTQFDQIFAFNMGDKYSGSAYTVDSKKMVKVGEYDMCTFTGVHSFQYEGTQHSCKYAAYAMVMKTNQAIVVWLVQDETADQSKSKLVEDYAYKMATSVWESVF